MRVLVTGATGFVGSRVALAAARRGWSVRASGRKTSGPEVDELRAAGIEYVPGDYTDAAFATGLTKGITHVCHLAAAWREAGAPAEHFRNVNVAGTLTLATSAESNGVERLLFCSTIGVHARAARDPVAEDAAFDITNPYEQSKLDAENALREFANGKRMKVAILRPADAYGPGDVRLLKLFKSVRKGRFPLVGAGNGKRHMLFVEDLAEAFLAACTAPIGAGDTFIIAGPETATLRDVLARLQKITGSARYGFRVPTLLMSFAAAAIEDLCRLLGRSPPLHRRTLDFYRTDVTYDISRARRVLGYDPKVGLDEGLARTWQWYQQKGFA